LEISSEIISCFRVKKLCFAYKNPVFGSKIPVFEGVGVKNRGFLIFQSYGKFGLCSIPNFPKITKK